MATATFLRAIVVLGSSPCAALPPVEVQIHDETTVLQDLAEMDSTDPALALTNRGFAILQPGVPEGDVVGKSLLSRRHADAIYRLREPVLKERLGFDWWFCGEGIQNLSMPLPDVPWPVVSFLNALPLVALPKIILLFRQTMRPFAVKPGGLRKHGTWWWHSDMTSGDVLVVDQLRSSLEIAQVSGEDGLQEVQMAAERLQKAIGEALIALKPSGKRKLDVKDEASEATESVSKLCSDLEVHLRALDYPRLGDQYVVHLRPALVRRFEQVESDLLGEVRLGKSVTIIKHGTESPGRVQIYTEDALVMPGYISDEINKVPGISGWISSTAYNGTRLLIQRDATKETPALEAARLELASVVLGTCEWFRLSDASDSMLLRANQRLNTTLAATSLSQATSAQLQCVALRYPKRSEMLLVILTSVTLFFGCVLFSALSAASAY